MHNMVTSEIYFVLPVTVTQIITCRYSRYEPTL
jgi:hypothetical protein